MRGKYLLQCLNDKHSLVNHELVCLAITLSLISVADDTEKAIDLRLLLLFLSRQHCIVLSY